ncbi:MAG: ECF transporter S component [Tissierellia bacterium]|nr:ECF transporter S component [Tissierellia bacterium]
MKDRNHVRNLVISGLLLALGLIIPYIFHSSGIAGNIFLPMHIPVLIGGFLLPPQFALLLGILTPIINSLITGMPSFFPIAIIMVFELGTYGLLASVLYFKLRLPTVIALILSMLGGRIIAGLVVFILAIFFAIPLEPITYIIGAITAGIPGIVIQLILIPILIHGIVRYTTIYLDYD